MSTTSRDTAASTSVEQTQVSDTDADASYAARPPWLALLLTLCPINLMMSLDKQVIGLASPLIAKEMHFSIVELSVVLSAAY